MSRNGRCLLPLCAGVLLGSPANAQTHAELEKARAAYLSRNYAEAEERLRLLIDPKTGYQERSLLSLARVNLAATYFAESQRDRARDLIEKLILADPTFEPDPLGFPGDFINAFIDVRANLQESIKLASQEAVRREADRRDRELRERVAREAYQRKIEALAAEESITVRSNRWVTLVPFGAGQFQNGRHGLGWLFLGTEAALGVATALTLPLYANARARADEEVRTGDIDQKATLYQRRANDFRNANLSLVGALVGVAVAGVVQANVEFVAERKEKRPRPLPKFDVATWRPEIGFVSPPWGGPGLLVGVSGSVR